MIEYKIVDVYIELTSLCNLKCKHCYNESGEKIYNIDKKEIFKIIDDIKKYNLQSISFSGGEPFLYKDLKEIIDYVLNNSDMIVYIISNGTVINEEIISFIKTNKRVVIQLSLDGSNAESHDKLRGKGSFDKLISTINLLKKNKIEYRFHSVINKYNYKEIDEIIELSKKLGALNIDIAYYKKKGRGNKYYNELCLQTDILLSVLKHLDTYKNSSEIKVTVPSVSYGECPLFPEKYNIREPIKMALRIDAEGNIYPCQLFTNKAGIIGNINISALSDVINSIELSNLKKLVIKDTINKCKNCFLKTICKGGCPATTIYDKFDGEYSEECILRRKLMSEIYNEIKCKRRKI